MIKTRLNVDTTDLVGSLRRAAAYTVAATTAAPPISPRISPISADGLMEIPPLSNVTPEGVQQALAK